ncbi:hypothetical protein WJX74_000973 [Apatococcus lobatus]|uniref:Fungal lipase-type domain-containing protein n=1 Tax=Apatococcus lobatus TaxID=904363 RepID=A0AAW1Q3C7_9CHLO
MQASEIAALREASLPGPQQAVTQQGHSLGGALGVLAAYDLAQAAAKQGLDVRLACYTSGAPRNTFGAPRMGDHSLQLVMSNCTWFMEPCQ